MKVKAWTHTLVLLRLVLHEENGGRSNAYEFTKDRGLRPSMRSAIRWLVGVYDNYGGGFLRYAIYKAYCQGACYDYVTFLSLAYFHISQYPLPTHESTYTILNEVRCGIVQNQPELNLF